jgi:hypothetical protein
LVPSPIYMYTYTKTYMHYEYAQKHDKDMRIFKDTVRINHTVSTFASIKPGYINAGLEHCYYTKYISLFNFVQNTNIYEIMTSMTFKCIYII